MRNNFHLTNIFIIGICSAAISIGTSCFADSDSEAIRTAAMEYYKSVGTERDGKAHVSAENLAAKTVYLAALLPNTEVVADREAVSASGNAYVDSGENKNDSYNIRY